MGALLMTKVINSGKVIDLVNKMDALFMTGITSSSGKSTHKMGPLRMTKSYVVVN